MKYCLAFLVIIFRLNEDLIRIIDCERGRRERPRSSFYVHVWNRLQRIKSVKMVAETSDKNQYSYFYIVNSFLKESRKNNEVGLGCRVWGRAPAGGLGGGALAH